MWRQDILYNDAQYFDTQHNDTQHNDTQHDNKYVTLSIAKFNLKILSTNHQNKLTTWRHDIRYNDAQHCQDTQHNDTQHDNKYVTLITAKFNFKNTQHESSK